MVENVVTMIKDELYEDVTYLKKIQSGIGGGKTS